MTWANGSNINVTTTIGFGIGMRRTWRILRVIPAAKKITNTARSFLDSCCKSEGSSYIAMKTANRKIEMLGTIMCLLL
jgi:hypothetical protein